MEVMAAWSAAEEGDPGAVPPGIAPGPIRGVGRPDPSQAVAEVVFGMSSLSGILLDDLADATGRARGQVLNGVHRRHLSEDTVWFGLRGFTVGRTS